MTPVSGGERRILFLAQLPPPIHGGTVVSQRIFDLLSDMDNVHMTHLWGGGAKTLNDIGKKDVSKILDFFGLLTKLSGRVLSERQHDLAYLTFTPWAHTAIRDAILVFVSKLLATRTLVHLHTLGLEKVLQPGSLGYRLIRWLLTGAELIAPTDDAARMARDSGIFSSVHTLANSAPDPGRPTITPSHKITCGWFGNMDCRKGVLQFVDTIASLRRAGLSVRGRIAGGPTWELSVADVERYVSDNGLKGYVQVLGRLSEEDKSRFLSELDLFIYLSRHDLAPLALIEAMAHGVAPIVFDTGGIRQMVGGYFAGNVLSPELEADACQVRILAIVQRYLDEPDLLFTDRHAARARYLSEFAEPVFYNRLVDIVSDPSPMGPHPRIASMANTERQTDL